MNIFARFGQGWDAGAAQGAIDSKAATRGLLETIVSGGKNLWNAGEVFLRNLDKAVKDIFGTVLAAADKDFDKSVIGGDGKYFDYVIKIPYILYYKMLSSTTTNIYEIPYSGTMMYESDGKDGWASKHLLDGFGATGLANMGGLTSYIGKNVKVNTTPTWDGASNSEGIKVETEFTLFNDSLDGAIKNFIFVNTLIPGNMWM